MQGFVIAIVCFQWEETVHVIDENVSRFICIWIKLNDSKQILTHHTIMQTKTEICNNPCSPFVLNTHLSFIMASTGQRSRYIPDSSPVNNGETASQVNFIYIVQNHKSSFTSDFQERKQNNKPFGLNLKILQFLILSIRKGSSSLHIRN